MFNSRFRLYIGLLFSAIGTVALIFSKDVLMAAIWLSFGNGIILSDPQLLRNKENTDPQPRLHPARKYASAFLFALAIALLALQIYHDFSATETKEVTTQSK